MSTAAVLLAAGGASRFGSAKQLAALRGRPLLQYAVDAALAVDALDPVVVVLGARADAIRAAVSFGRARVVEAPDWADGQSASLRRGLAALPDADAVLVLLGDMPGVGPEVIRRVLAAPADAPAARAVYDGVAAHPVLLRRAFLDRAAELSGDAGFRGLLGDAVGVECGSLGDPQDIDTPDQLEAVQS